MYVMYTKALQSGVSVFFSSHAQSTKDNHNVMDRYVTFLWHLSWETNILYHKRICIILETSTLVLVSSERCMILLSYILNWYPLSIDGLFNRDHTITVDSTTTASRSITRYT
jgi:hypothetical protein